MPAFICLAPIPYIEPRVDMADVGVFDLFDAASYLQSVSSRISKQSSIESVVSAPKITIRRKINLIARRLRTLNHTTFRSLLGSTRTRVEIVVTFLAMLELIKRHLIKVWQANIFDDIQLQLTSSWDEEQRFELEFDE